MTDHFAGMDTAKLRRLADLIDQSRDLRSKLRLAERDADSAYRLANRYRNPYTLDARGASRRAQRFSQDASALQDRINATEREIEEIFEGMQTEAAY